MSVKFLVVVVVVLAIGHDTAQSCTLFGNTDRMERSQSTVEGLFLDLQNPAPCNGTVTAWNYCFYRVESSPDTNYIVDFVVYRRSGGNYELVESRTVDMSGNQLDSDFRCNTIPLMESEMFVIQENDVLGACLTDAGNNQKMLDILAEGVANTLYVTDGCIQSGVDIPTRINRNQLATSTSFALHLFVDITQPPPSTSLTSNTVFPGLTSTPAGLVAASTAGNAPIDPSQDSMVSSSTPSFLRIPSSSSAEIPGAINRISRSFSAEISLVSFPVDSATLSPTTDQPQSPAGGLNVGIVVAVVIVVLVLGVSAVVVVGIIVCCMRQRRYTVKGANIHSGIDNVVYSVTNDALTVTMPADHPYEALPGHYDFEISTKPAMSIPFDYSLPQNGLDAPVYYSSIGYMSDYSQLLEQDKEKDIYAEQSPYLAPATRQEDLYAQIKSYGIRNIPREEVETVSHLGSGHFGNVDRGLWRSANKAPVEVALKSLTEGASDLDEVKFLQEAAIMAQFKHPNVVSLCGVVSKGKPIILVVELVHEGDLRECLNFMRPNSGDPSMPQQLLKYSQQVALGMHYLSSKGFVHRDLAARNILVSQNNICKVADFGMSRDLADETYYVSHGGKIPVKWTAPEALNYHKYSTASDVWSYGCLLYEIWSLGHKPFEGIRNQEVIQKVNSGYRLPPPPGCPRVIYELMIMNWHPDSSLRPGFRDLLLALLQNVEAVLAIPEDAQATHAQASVLGAPLEAGEQMYHDLQQTYMEQ